MAGADEPVSALAVRTSYFREEYAYGNEIRIAGIEPFLHHPAFVEAARAIHGRPIIEPAIVYANLMVPGQELAVHTDVPEFRGANRKVIPQWLLVVMLHSGCFDDVPHADRDRNRVVPRRGATAARSRTGPTVPTVRPVPTRCGTTRQWCSTPTPSSTAWSASPISPPADLPRLRPGMTLDYTGDRTWVVARRRRRRGDPVRLAELRFSVSWKAYCFADEHERDTWREHRDDLTLDRDPRHARRRPACSRAHRR